MTEYTQGKCPQYKVDVGENGIANFTFINYNASNEKYTIDLVKENLLKGEGGYSSPHPKRHFICREDGDLVVAPEYYNRLILLEWDENNEKPKIFYRAMQWEFDWWMNLNFPESANSKVYRKIKEYINYKI